MRNEEVLLANVTSPRMLEAMGHRLRLSYFGHMIRSVYNFGHMIRSVYSVERLSAWKKRRHVGGGEGSNK